jgi:geranylgeranyl diphosphate synthase type I
MSDALSPYLDAIEEELRAALLAPSEQVAPLYAMMQYHLGWLDEALQPFDAPRGKRLRPLMCLLACDAARGEWHRSLPAAAAIELIHNFSLIHDDIEDDSATRRHRSTVWHLWGLAQGVNTGDTMWAVARRAVYRLREQGYDAAVVLEVAERLDATCLRLCTGQYLDIDFESRESVALAEYETMIGGKTAALLSTALAVGARLGGATDGQTAAYAEFGRELGLAFQVVDDILGIWGDPAVTGKSAATDILTRKKTLPVLYAHQWEQQYGHGDLVAMYAGETLDEAQVPQVLALLERAGARAYAHEQAEAHTRLMLAHLDEAGGREPAATALRDLALSLLDRSA